MIPSITLTNIVNLAVLVLIAGIAWAIGTDIGSRISRAVFSRRNPPQE